MRSVRRTTATKLISYKENFSDIYGKVNHSKKVITKRNTEQLVKGKAKGAKIARVQSICNNIEANFMKQAETERKKQYNKKRNEKKYAKRKAKR